MSGAPGVGRQNDAESGSGKADKDFLIVGLGASAGGVKAFKEFFAHVPPQSGAAYVVILHLSPDYDSKLAEILQLTTEMPVTQVTQAVEIGPDHVYVIPPNQSLAMSEGMLTISRMTRIEERHAPVDIFFRTLAETHDAHAVCVLLSGTGADGSMGLKRVKERGGLCIAQEPGEAEFDDMPRHAIDTGFIDYVLPVAEMPATIVGYKESIRHAKVPAELSERTETDVSAIRDVLTQLRTRTGHDFANYKRATVLRRVERRINVHELPDLGAYARFMREHPAEAQALLKDLLISVTNFFRDREAFEALERDVIPKLFAGKTVEDHVRVWVAGCATGEEAYTVAILLAEHAETLAVAPNVQVFATDIDEAAVAQAREGYYTLNDAADVSPGRLRRFFVKVMNGYRVRRELRELVLFAQHNLIKDPPFSHLDLATCRNLLIYLNRTAQKRAMEVFHFALRPGGFLFLGSSESVDGASDSFITIEKDAHIFQNRATPARLILPVPELSPAVRIDARREPPRVMEVAAQERFSYADLHARLLEQYAPPSVVVTEAYDILHLSERAGRYLQYAGGAPSHNLLKVVRPELRLALRAALYQAAQRRQDTEARRVSLQIGDRLSHVNLLVRPVLRENDPARGLLLVVFEETGEAAESLSLSAGEAIASVEPAAQQFEDELTSVKGQLRATIEQYETQAEELKASNEELQAINEELRSTAEELETSKEELQSVNEELTTVNQELKIKVEELDQSNNDIRNLINSTDFGTLFLDRSLRLKLFTSRARDIFNLIPTDIERPLLDITNKLLYEGLHADVAHVLDRLQTVEREVETRDQRWFLMRALPYRTAKDRIDGVVLTFTDITGRKRGEEALRASEERFRTLVGRGADMITISDRDGNITYASPTTVCVSGYTPEEFVAQHPFDSIHPEDRPRCEEVFNQLVASPGLTLGLQHRVRHKDGAWSWVEGTFTSLFHEPAIGGLVANVRDITDRKHAEERLRESEERLRLLVESAKDYAIFTLDLDRRVSSWNSGAEATFGYTEAEILGQSGDILFAPEDRRRHAPEKEVRTALAVGSASDERWHLRKDGSQFYASGVMTPLRDGTVRGFVKIARDLTERKLAEEALRRAHDELEERVSQRTIELLDVNEALLTEVHERAAAEERARGLVRQIVTAQEDERRRIARDLHDQLGQQLTGLRLKLESYQQGRGADDAEGCGELDEIQSLAKRIDDEVDFLAWELRPASLDELGLAPALATFVQEWSKHFGIPAEFHTTEAAQQRLPMETETNLYRIAQEALNNTYKHAAATRTDVIFERRGDQVILIVEDDGRGFDASEVARTDSKQIGLINMRERASFVGGSLEIESEPSGGTTVFARVPIRLPDGKGSARGDGKLQGGGRLIEDNSGNLPSGEEA